MTCLLFSGKLFRMFSDSTYHLCLICRLAKQTQRRREVESVIHTTCKHFMGHVRGDLLSQIPETWLHYNSAKPRPRPKSVWRGYRFIQMSIQHLLPQHWLGGSSVTYDAKVASERKAADQRKEVKQR